MDGALGAVGDLAGPLLVLLPGILLAGCRLAGLALTAPVFASKPTPLRIRGALFLALTVVVGPVAEPGATALRLGGDLIALGILGAAELALGAAAGLVGRLITGAAQAAGELAGMTSGFGFARAAGVEDIDSAAMEGLFKAGALMAFLAVGGQRILLRSIAASFETLPPGEVLMGPAVFPTLSAAMGSAFALALSLAAPAVMGGLVVAMGVAIASRAAPQMHAFTLYLSIATGVSLGLLAFAYPGMVLVLGTTFEAMTDPLEALLAIP